MIYNSLLWFYAQNQFSITTSHDVLQALFSIKNTEAAFLYHYEYVAYGHGKNSSYDILV